MHVSLYTCGKVPPRREILGDMACAFADSAEAAKLLFKVSITPALSKKKKKKAHDTEAPPSH